MFDLLLASALVWLAWQVLAHGDPFRSTILFIAMGLLMALAWVRLQAPDIALAEAAIGAGLTGALLLDAARQEGTPDRGAGASERLAPGSESEPVNTRHPALATAGALVLGLGLAWALLRLPGDRDGLRPWVEAKIPESGVEHPVTAVLLNFRAYDTFLEIGVLVVAMLGVLSLRGSQVLVAAPGPRAAPILAAFARVIVPLMVLVAGYLLWAGAYAPGGAFQAGAVLTAAGVLLRLSGAALPARAGDWPFRVLLLSGFALFLLVAATPATLGGALLQFPPGWASRLIVMLESTLVVSIAAALTGLYLGAREPVGPGEAPP